MNENLLLAATLIVMLIGLAGILLPVLPGIELIWLAAIGYGILHGFTWAGAGFLLFITLLFLAGFSSDIWITGKKLKAAQTSWQAVCVGIIFLLAGSLFFTPVVGVLLGLGSLTFVEYLRHRDWRKAFSSTRSAATGCGISFVFKFGIGLLMMAAWAGWVFWGG